MKVRLALAVVAIASAFVNLDDEPRAAPAPNLSRSEQEQEIASMLSHHSYFDLTSRTVSETIWGAEPADPSLVFAETTARFEGCVVVVRLERPGLCQTGNTWSSKEERIELSFLKQEGRVGAPSAGYESLGASVTYEFRPEISGQLRDLSDRSAQITGEALTQFPDDILARMRWLADAFDAKIQSPILSGAQSTWGLCPAYGRGHVEPLGWLDFAFRVDPARADEFLLALGNYREQHCTP